MNISELEKLFIGFDRLPTWPTTTEYPRYNIVRGEQGYQIQVACPGWNRDQIQVTFREDNNTLTICAIMGNRINQTQSSNYKETINKLIVDVLDKI